MRIRRRSKHRKPKVTVVITTFNHERYIAEALDGVLAQEVDGGFEVLVSEDCSTDGTRAILRDYEARHRRVRLMLSPQNVHSNEVLTRAIDAARGQYVAILDGDDYWTAPHKLQSQVEFLETHAGCSSCFHNATVLYEDGRPPQLHNPPEQRTILTLDDLWERNPVATCSMMFRNGLIRKWPDWYHGLRYGDWPLHILHAEHGAIGYLDEVMSVYRVHSEGVFGGLDEVEQLREILRFYDEIDECFDYAHHSGIERGRARHQALLAQATGAQEHPQDPDAGARSQRPRPLQRATSRPDVSVIMIAFNIDDYVEQAIESVLMQGDDLTYEILVGEDCSTDRTREIVVRYARNYPGTVRPLLRERNLGMNPNFAATFLEGTGRYIALLDGDDFWSSRLKLERQVAFLEAHPDCAMCFHNATVIYENGEEAQHPFHMRRPRYRLSREVPKPISQLDDLSQGNFIQTCSVMYRGGVVRELPDWYLSMPTFDWPLHVLHAERGDIGYLDEVLGTYRARPGGFWSGGMSKYDRIEDIETLIGAYHTLNRHLDGRWTEAIQPALSYFLCEAAEVAIGAGRASQARRYASEALSRSAGEAGPEQQRAMMLFERLAAGDESD